MLKTETLKLKLEAGKKYVDRRGRVFGPLAICGQSFCESSRMPMWYENGRIGSELEADTDMDLVAEYREPEPTEPEPCPIDQSLCILDACCGSCDRYTAEQLQIKPAEPIIASLHNDCECCGPFESFEPVEVQVEIVEAQEPQRGQFWVCNHHPFCCVRMLGKSVNGQPVAVDENGEYVIFDGRWNDLKFWHNEPGFTNFDGPIPAEQKPSPLPAEPPTNQQLFEMIANLRDQLDGMNERLRIVEGLSELP